MVTPPAPTTNGSAFAGLTPQSVLHLTLGATILRALRRDLCVLAIAGSMAARKLCRLHRHVPGERLTFSVVLLA